MYTTFVDCRLCSLQVVTRPIHYVYDGKGPNAGTNISQKRFGRTTILSGMQGRSVGLWGAKNTRCSALQVLHSKELHVL